MSKLRDKIANAKDIKTELVPVPQWEVEILIKGLTGQQRAKILNECMVGRSLDLVLLYPALAIACCYDPETDEAIFGEMDRDMLNSKSGGALETIAGVAMRLSGIEAGAKEKAEKN